MKTFTTVIQVSANKFDVFKFSAVSESQLFPMTSKKGVTVSIWESNSQNDKYCFGLAEKMNNANNIKTGQFFIDLQVGAGQPERVKQNLQKTFLLEFIKIEDSQYVFNRIGTEGNRIGKIYFDLLERVKEL